MIFQSCCSSLHESLFLTPFIKINYQELNYREFDKSTYQKWLSSHILTHEPNLNLNPLDYNTTIMTNIFWHSKDNILLILATIRVNLNQSSHTHSAQTNTHLITIPFSQHNLFTSLSYKNLIFRLRVSIKGKSKHT